MDATSAAGQSSASSVDGAEAQVPLRRPPSLTGEVPLRQVGAADLNAYLQAESCSATGCWCPNWLSRALGASQTTIAVRTDSNCWIVDGLEAGQPENWQTSVIAAHIHIFFNQYFLNR